MAKKQASLVDVLAQMREKDVQIGTLAEFKMVPDGMTTGNIALDYLTGVGGFPRGRIIEMFGPPSSGKSTAALSSLALEQQKIIAEGADRYVAFFDYERSLDELYCAALGLDVNHPSFVYMQPVTFEDGMNVFRRLMATGQLSVGVFDSVAAMVSQNELDSDTGAAKVADRAKMLHQACRQIAGPLHEYGCTAIFLNHTMELLDATPMGQKLAARGIKRETQPGGTALKFYSSLRIAFKQVGNMRTAEVNPLTGEKDDLVLQTRVQATVVKNKVGDPFGTAELRIRYGRGFSQEQSVLAILDAYKVVAKDSVGGYTFPAELCSDRQLAAAKARRHPNGYKVRGEDKVLKELEADPAWLEVLRVRAQGLLEEHGVRRVTAAEAEAMSSDEEPGAVLESSDIDALLGPGLAVDTKTGEVSSLAVDAELPREGE